MTLNEIIITAKSIQAKWISNVVNSRPGEQSQLQSHLGSAATYDSVTAELTRWVSVLSELANRPRVSQSISKQLLLPLGASLQWVNRALDHASNGVEWMCTERNFATQYALAVYLIRSLTFDSAREAAAITDAAKDRIAQDVGAIQNATEQAKLFVTGWPDLNTKIVALEKADELADEQIEAVSAAANKAVEAITAEEERIHSASATSKHEIATATDAFNSALKVANEVLTEAQKIHSEAQKIRGETQSTAAKTKTDLENSTVALNTAIEQYELTQARLTKALQNAQMEGLAGSFTRMKEDTRAVIKDEQNRFDRALAYLILVAVAGIAIEGWQGFPKTSLEQFYTHMLKMLSFAAPGIWIAWVTSKKLNALNRVFSDYEYKSAAALAYESYKQAVAESDSDELKQQLLVFAIRSFGENPTHYYESAKNEASSPFESFLEKMPFFSKSKSESTKSTL